MITEEKTKAHNYLQRNGFAEIKNRPTNLLTDVELTTIRLVACGYSSKEIGVKFNNSEQTIKNRLSVSYKKLHVVNAPSAVVKCIKLGLIDLEKITIKE